ncbi:Ty3/gypsy retrotransposon protein [Quillaja saponaria]|uniref:Ty3/gypsy retrotransposon protein n=1 Tax=Quillaja saponaria TaxID=32244 RepID=A0AAD7P980_QUISA|nr:Ty3/gypsy retrotransposon protein [Quillaja saponaria]
MVNVNGTVIDQIFTAMEAQMEAMDNRFTTSIQELKSSAQEAQVKTDLKLQEVMDAVALIQTSVAELRAAQFHPEVIREPILPNPPGIPRAPPEVWRPPPVNIQQDQLRRKGRLVVGADEVLRKELLELFHSSPGGGHSGMYATSKRISGIFYWKGLQKEVRNFVRTCEVCQRFKTENVAYPGLLQPLPIPHRNWSSISLDFIDGLLRSGGKTTILVIMDRLNKFAHFLALQHPYTASVVAQAFMDNICKIHGMPDEIVSDRDTIFLSNFWKEMFKLQQVKLQYSSAYHPQTDGQIEVVNRSVETYLRCFSGDCPKKWVYWLPLAQWWYNTSFHTAILMTPYQAMLGQQPPCHIPYVNGDSNNEEVDRTMSNREAIIHIIRDNLLKAQNRMKTQVDKNRSEREFVVGE